MKISLLANLAFYIPELLVLITMMGVLVLETTYKGDEKARNYPFVAAIIGLLLAVCFLIMNLSEAPTAIFYNALVIDSFSTFMKITLLLGALGGVYVAWSSDEIDSNSQSEFIALALGATLGGMLLSSANNLLNLYLGVETLSILSYILASMRKQNSLSLEAGLKYVLYGALAAGIMLYGIGHIYGLVGSLNFSIIAKKISFFNSYQLFLLIPAFLCFFVGLGYKISCFPFHMWTPDVYEGSPTPSTAFFTVVPKMAGIAALVRIGHIFFGEGTKSQEFWIHFITFVSITTMFVGNITAIGQKSVKRMLAYSSIAHAGFILMGVTVLNQNGHQAILFYSLSYFFMTLVAFAIISQIENTYGNDHYDRFSGLIHKQPFLSIVLCLVMFSLAGLPPFSGFVGKFYLISSAVNKELYFLSTVAVINSVIALFYYLRLVRVVVFGESDGKEAIVKPGITNTVIIFAATVPIVSLGIFWNDIMKMAMNATIYLPK